MRHTWRKKASPKSLVLWFLSSTFIGGALGLIISYFLMGRIASQIILMGILFGNVIGFTSILSAKFILPLYRPLPMFLDISLRVITLVAGGFLGTVCVFLFNPRFVVTQGEFVFFMISLGSLIALIVGLIIYSYERMKREVERHSMEVVMRRDIEERLRELAAFSELQALKAQINPHFLFNTLNTIAALISTDQEQAEETVHNLADLFRYALDTAEREFVPLSEELSFLDRYVNIEQARFGDRLKVVHTIDPASKVAKVPPLILQPIVENALRHGIGRRKEGGTISITSTCDDHVCIVSIHDNGAGIPEDRLEEVLTSGTGLRNVNERLMNVYPESKGVIIESVEGEGTTFTLSFPRKRLETQNAIEDDHR